MRKFKYILVLLLLTATTMVINGGTRVRCAVEPVKAAGLVKEAVADGFPDLVSFN